MATSCNNSNCMPTWHKPCPPEVKHSVGLSMMNSLTRKKEPFVTMDGGKVVKWYMCGPTVYAPAHLGHARTYLGFDILRRILSLHFGYQVVLVMNITDIDDKIIQRANEQGISCDQLSKQFEAEFHQDMAALNVAPPDVLTRVTEYMDVIVPYIQQIIDRGLAYESNGSVYFHVAAFDQLPNMSYCKLEPENKNNADLLAEGEGGLMQDFASDKKSSRDFALWKRSKEGEPRWPSPWGDGRPGWHIECSVMASDVFAQLGGYDSVIHPALLHNCDTQACCMDIHSGGVDLKFPHHDNEMAQAEAHLMCHQWVNYFVHSGHLHIKGFKMSKSLKNFITIRQALEHNSARQIRLLFLLHKYNAPMDYGDNTMSHAMTMEHTFVEFFHNVKAVLRTVGKTTNCRQRWDDAASRDLQRQILRTQGQVDAALQDDFDTPTVMSCLLELVRATNIYMELCEQKAMTPVSFVLRNAAKYITQMFRILGLIPDSSGVDIGFPVSSSSSTAADSSSSSDEEGGLVPILDALMEFRSSVREKARAKDLSGVLDQCDVFRDDTLPPLGIRLEDKVGGKSVWKLADPVELMKEREQREMENRRREEDKRLAAEEAARKEALNKLSPAEYMKQLTLEEDASKCRYSAFDESGMPTHFHDGEPLNKNQMKKATKEYQTQQKKFEKYNVST